MHYQFYKSNKNYKKGWFGLSLSSQHAQYFVLILIVIISLTAFFLGRHTALQQLQQSGVAEFNPISLIISPGAEDKFLDLIRKANESIDIEMYLFTNKRIADALADAKQRGVKVRVILERDVEGESIDEVLSILSFNKIEYKFASQKFKVTHSKFVVFDKKIVVIGSHNWSKSSMEKNREVSVAIPDRNIAEQLSQIFEEDWKIAELL